MEIEQRMRELEQQLEHEKQESCEQAGKEHQEQKEGR